MFPSSGFIRKEFSCRCGCGFNTVDAELLAVLEKLRNHFEQPIMITSGARCYSHNVRVGGEQNSKHLYGQAADIVVKGVSPKEVQDFLESEYTFFYGIGRYHTFTHIDVGEKRRWQQPDNL